MLLESGSAHSSLELGHIVKYSRLGAFNCHNLSLKSSKGMSMLEKRENRLQHSTWDIIFSSMELNNACDPSPKSDSENVKWRSRGQEPDRYKYATSQSIGIRFGSWEMLYWKLDHRDWKDKPTAHHCLQTCEMVTSMRGFSGIPSINDASWASSKMWNSISIGRFKMGSVSL